jgi:hypothetical protein
LEAPYSQKTQSEVGEEEEEEEPEEEPEEEEEGRNQDAINLPDANSSRARRTVALAHPERFNRDGDVTRESGRDVSRATSRERDFIDGG